MSLKSFFFGKKAKSKQQGLLSPEQQQGLSKFFSQGIQTDPTYQAGNQYLQNLLSGSPESTAAFEAPLMQQFQQQTVPALAERFAGMGTGAGAGNSSAFAGALGQAGKELTTNIGALRGQLQQGAAGQALQYAQQPQSNLLAGLGIKSFENQYQPGTSGLVSNVLSGAAQGFGSALGGGINLSSMFGGGQKPQPGQQ